ncbi:hypothetical protein L9F63_027918, partial [Diploptera punctata]
HKDVSDSISFLLTTPLIYLLTFFNKKIPRLARKIGSGFMEKCGVKYQEGIENGRLCKSIGEKMFIAPYRRKKDTREMSPVKA